MAGRLTFEELEDLETLAAGVASQVADLHLKDDMWVKGMFMLPMKLIRALPELIEMVQSHRASEDNRDDS